MLQIVEILISSVMQVMGLTVCIFFLGLGIYLLAVLFPLSIESVIFLILKFNTQLIQPTII